MKFHFEKLCYVLTSLLVFHHACVAQEWVTRSNAAAETDRGVGRKAIISREILDISKSGTNSPDGKELVYNHPGCPCETREGTIVLIWNGGTAEAKPNNRVYVTRKEQSSKKWSQPTLLEPDVQIDAGTVYQPLKKDAPIICGYWLGVPRRSNCAYRISHDDGKTWSTQIKMPLTDDGYFANYGEKRLRLDMHHPLEWPDGTLWYAAGNHHGPGGRATITVVSPDNYTGQERNGTPWKLLHVIPKGCENMPLVKPLESSDAKTHPCWYVLSKDYQKLMFVSRSGNAHEFTQTNDGGKTWGPWTRFPAKIVGNRGVGAVSLDVQGGACQGWHIQTGTVKDGLTVAISNDPANADSWKQVLLLNPDEIEDSDPNLFQSRIDRKVHLMFTGRKSKVIKYYTLDPDQLIASGK
jgi:hypothetical protein